MLVPVVIVVGVALLLFGVLDGEKLDAPPKRTAPPPLTLNTPTGNSHSGLKVGDVLDTRLSTTYDDHDVSGDAGGDAVFCFTDQAQPAGQGPQGPLYDYSADANSDAGKNFRRLFLRHVYFPAARVECSQDIGVQHVAGAIALLKGFSSNPRVSNYTKADPGVADATAIVQSVIKDIPVAGGIANLLFGIGNAEILQAFADSNKAWFNLWADLYTPPQPTDFIMPSGDGGNGETPLPPQNVYGGGDGGRVDATWLFASGPAMWKRDPGKWVCDNPDPIFGCPPGSGTYVAGQGEVQAVPWILADDEIPADLKGRFRAGQAIYPRARLFSVSPTLGLMILPWRFVGGEAAVIRDRINLVARLYRVIDLLACITWGGYHPPDTAIWTDPKLGKVVGSIFPASPLQTPEPLAAKALAAPAVTAIITAPITQVGIAPPVNTTPTPPPAAPAPTPAPTTTTRPIIVRRTGGTL